MRKKLFIFILFVVLCMNGCRWTLGEKRCKSDEDCPYDMYCGSEKVCVFYPDGGMVDVGHRDTGITDISGEEIRDYGVDIGDVVEDVEEIKDYGVDGGVEIEDVEDIGDNMVVDVGDVSVDIEDVGEDTQDVADVGIDVSDISDISDVCTPNCKDKQCGDDGCGGSCGSCGDNGVCNVDKCECISGYLNCNNDWGDGCERQTSDPKHVWSKIFGGSNNLDSRHISIDGSGNIYITGWFDSYTIDFGGGEIKNNGGIDIFLAKFDSNGNHLWSKNFGGSADDYGETVSVDSSGNVYIAGDFYSSAINFGGGSLTNLGGFDTIFLAKFDSRGNHLWSKVFGGNHWDEGFSLYVDISGSVYIIGDFCSSKINFGGGDINNNGGSCNGTPCADIYLAKFDRDGNYLWSKSFGGNSNDVGYYVYGDNSGNLYITGWYGSSTINFGGSVLTNSGGYDIFLAKFDSNGNHLWSKSFGGSGDDLGYSVSVDSFSNIYLTGKFKSSTINFGGNALTNNGDYDIFLVKFDSNGNHKWSKSFGGGNWDYGEEVYVDNSSNVYLTGKFKSNKIDFGGGSLTNSGVYDVYLAKFDSNGNYLWSKNFGGSTRDVVPNWNNGISISVDSFSNIYGTGYFSGSNIDFGGCPLSSAGGYVIYLIKYAP